MEDELRAKGEGRGTAKEKAMLQLNQRRNTAQDQDPKELHAEARAEQSLARNQILRHNNSEEKRREEKRRGGTSARMPQPAALWTRSTIQFF